MINKWIWAIIMAVAFNLTVDLSNLHSITNDKYYPLYKDQSRFLFLYGGASSGKSVFIADKFIFRILTEQHHRFLFLRKVGASCRDSVFMEALDSARKFGLIRNKDFFVNNTRLEINFPDFDSTILCSGLDDPEKIKSIKGITGDWEEEATEYTQDDLYQMRLRLRGLRRSYKQSVYSCNPINISHHLKTGIIDLHPQPDQTYKIVHSTYKDNRFLTQEDIDDIESMTGYHKDVYALGKWGVIGKLVYPDYSIENICQDPFKYDNCSFGTDFGFTHANVKLLTARDEKGDQFILKEVSGENWTNSDFIDRCLEVFTQDEIDNIPDYCDSQAPDKIVEFKRAGFRSVGADKPGGSVLSGIDWLKSRHIYIHPSCIRTISEIQQYQHDKDKHGIYQERPIEKYDDAMAAMRYSIDKFRKKRREKEPRLYAVTNS